MASRDVPPGLSSREQWVCWRNECRECGAVHEPEIKECPECGEKTTKRPVNPETGAFARADDPSTWTTLESAEEYNGEHDTHGVGFMFSDDDPIAGVDLDDCRDPETGEIDDWAIDIVETLASFVEVSPSGTGLHVYIYGEIPEDGGNRKDGVEIYDKRRYFTVTGDTIARSHSSINYRQEQLEAVHEGHVDSGSEIADVGDMDVEIPDDRDVQETFTNDLGESLEEIRERDAKLNALLTDLVPEDYDYPSASEADFAAVDKLWWYRFDRQQIVDIFFKHRYRDKVHRPSTYLGAAAGERYDPRPGGEDDVEILEDREEYASIDEADLPEQTNFVLDKPPREGGSHASIDHLSNRPTIILASRHAICEHHLDILADVMPEGDTAVHYVGNERACEHGGGGDCPKRVGGDDFRNLFDIENEAKEIVHTQRTVTAEDAPDRFCPAQFISKAEKYADSVVTVPNLLENLETDVSGHNLLIDEEQALSYFRPASAELVTVEMAFDSDGTVRYQTQAAPISDQFHGLEAIRQDIYDDWNERRKDAEERGGTWRRNSWEKDILNAVTYLEYVKDSLGVTDVVEENPEYGYHDILEELSSRASSITPPTPKTDPDEFREKLGEYTEKYYYDDSTAPGDLIEAALYQYDKKPFDFKKAGNAHKLRMIAGRQVFHQSTLRKFAQIGVIAGPEGELLFDDTGMDAKVIKINQFRYEDDFVILPLGREKDDGMEKPSKQRQRARNVSKELNRRAHPHLAVAGTKERAKSHHASLSSGTADIIASPESPAKDIFSTWSVGGSAIIYENSAVSRGIDAPPFDISVVVSSGFATPYWEARKKFWDGEDKEEYKYARAIESQLKSHELTNAVLRPAPTRHVDDHTGTKFIVLADWDAPRIRYLQDRILPAVGNAKKAANVLEQVTIGGGLRTTIDQVYEYVGGEQKFIEEAMSTEFKEKIYDRPEYDLGELETWIDNWYLPRNTVEMVKKAIPRGGGVTDIEGTMSLLGWSRRGKTSAALTILERMGLAESYKEDDGSPGESKTVWEWSK